MTPQELKNSIIQLAMQGRLVDQIENEGTGSELFNRIMSERNRLGIRENKKIEPITEDIIPFDIPSSWCWARFGEVVTYNMGKTPPRAESQWWENEVPWVSIADMPENGHITFTKEGVSRQAIAEKFSNRISPFGTMIMSFKLTVGRVSILDIDAVHNEAIISIFPLCDSDNSFQRYLFYLLPAITQYGDSKNAIKGKTLNDTSISNLLIPLPPLAEQKRIVAKIEELLPLIDRYEQAWTRLEDFNKRFPGDMQKSILQMAIQGKLVEQRPEEGTGEELYQQIQFEKQTLIKAGKLKKTKALPDITEEAFPYDVPDTWKKCYIDDIAFVTKLAGFEYTEYVAPNLAPSGIPLFKGKNVQNGHVVIEFESFIPESVADELPRSQIRKKCLLTPYVGTIGNIAIFDGSFRAHLGSNVGKIELIGGNVQYVLEEYVLFYLRSFIGYLELTKFKKATAQESISIEAIRNVIIPLPPLAEQKRIVARLEELLPLCERLK